MGSCFLSLSLSLIPLSLSLSIVRYAYFTSTNIDDVTFGAHFLLYIIELRGEITKGGSSHRDRAVIRIHTKDRGSIDEDPSIFQEGHKLCEFLQLLLRQTDFVRLIVLFLVDLFAWLHYSTVDGPAPVNSGLSRLVQRHPAHRRHGRQV